MLKTSIFAGAALALATFATAASAQGWRQHGYAPNDQSGYGYGNGTSALGRSCPPGYFPHSWPNGSGVRCERGDSYIYPAPF